MIFFLLLFSKSFSRCNDTSCIKGNSCRLKCNTKYCFYDFQRCNDCNLGCTYGIIGDGVCNPTCLTSTCKFDGIDCVNNCNDQCFEGNIGNGICDPECNTASCLFDLGDCNQFCSDECSTSMVGDGVCNLECLTESCSFDLGDCDYNIYITEEGNGEGSIEDPYGDLETALMNLQFGVLNFVYIGPGIFYLDNSIFVDGMLGFGLVLIGNDTEIRVKNLTLAFDVRNLVYFEVRNLKFDGYEYWIEGCNEYYCSVSDNWICNQEECTNPNGYKANKSIDFIKDIWKSCSIYNPLTLFNLSSIKFANFSDNLVQNFGFLKSFIVAVESSLEVSKLAVKDSDIFTDLIKASAKNDPSSIIQAYYTYHKVNLYTKTLTPSLVLQDINVSGIFHMKSILNTETCIYPKKFKIINSIGIENLVIENVIISNLSIRTSSLSGLITVEASNNFSISNIQIFDSILSQISVVNIVNYPNILSVFKSTSLITNIKADNIFFDSELVRLSFKGMLINLLIFNVSVTNSFFGYYGLVINAMDISTAQKTIKFTNDIDTVFEFNKTAKLTISDIYIQNINYNSSLFKFDSFISIELSRITIDSIFSSNNNIQLKIISKDFYTNYLSTLYKNLEQSYNSTFNLTSNKYLNLNSISIENSIITNSAIYVYKNFEQANFQALKISNVSSKFGIYLLNDFPQILVLDSLHFTTSFFDDSGIYCGTPDSITISNSVFDQMFTSSIKASSKILNLKSSSFMNSRLTAPHVLLVPVFNFSEFNIIDCVFTNNFGYSPADIFIKSLTTSSVNINIINTKFSKSLSESPISLSTDENSIVKTIKLEGCSISDFKSTNYKGIMDFKLIKGSVLIKDSKIFNNQNTDNSSPVFYHNSFSSELITFENCEIYNNKISVFLLQNDFIIQQNNRFTSCSYSKNSGILYSLENTNSYITNSSFFQNTLKNPVIVSNIGSSVQLTNSNFYENILTGNRPLIEVQSSSFNISHTKILNNTSENSYVVSLTSADSQISSVFSSKNRAYTIFNILSSSVNIYNMTSANDLSYLFISSSISKINLTASFFSSTNSLFQLTNVNFNISNTSITSISNSHFSLIYTKLTADSLVIHNSPGSITSSLSTLSFNLLSHKNAGSIFSGSSEVSISNSELIETDSFKFDQSSLLVALSTLDSISSISISGSSLSINSSIVQNSLATPLFLKNSTGSITLSVFQQNTGRQGGCINSEYSSLAISSSEFKHNSATDGGAIYYYKSSITELNVSYISNKADHGPDKATPFSSIVPSDSNNYTQNSGSLIKNISFILKDDLNQTVSSDNTTSLIVHPNNSNIIINGARVQRVTQGQLSIESLAITTDPGSTEFFSVLIQNTGLSANFSITFQNCSVGEIITSDKVCFPCGNNTYSLGLEDLSCKPCPFGAVCLGKNIVLPAAGYWSDSKFPENFYRCPNPKACLQGKIQEKNCEFSYDSTLCGTCVKGYKLKGSYNCAKCPEYWLSVLIVIIFSICLAGIIAFMVWSNVRNLNKSKSMTALLIKILINYCQSILIFSSIDLKWPDPVLNIYDYSSVFSSSSSQLLSFSCTDIDTLHSSFFGETTMTALFPFLLTGATLVFWVLVGLIRKNIRYVKVHFNSTFVVIVVLLHTSISNSILSVFSCKKINGQYWSTSDYSLRCYEGVHLNTLLYVGIPGLVIWCFTVPIIIFFSLVYHRKKLQDEDTKVKYKMLFGGYKPNMYYWEMIVMLRKFSIRVIAIILTSAGTINQGLGIMMTLVLYMAVHITNKPYEQDCVNSLERNCIIVLFFHAACGIAFSTEISDQSKLAISWIIFAINMLFLGQWSKLFFGNIFASISKSKFYSKIVDRVLFRKRCKITINNDEGVIADCNKFGLNEMADKSIDIFYPKNPSNSYNDNESVQQVPNAWTVNN